MSNRPQPDWDPRAAEVLRDQRAAYDAMRESCPVAYSELMQWSLFRHEDVMRVLLDHETFSSAVSDHLSVPSGMDPPEHTPYRRIVERYFAHDQMNAFEPTCRKIVAELVSHLLASSQVELMADFALPFAVRVQCDFLGWPTTLQEPLICWTRKNHTATLAQDRKSMSEIAREFEGFIDELLERRIQAGAKPTDDVTAALMHEMVWGRPLSNEEIASLLRNWTVGEIGTISAAMGILVHYLAQHRELQGQLRAQPLLLPTAIDEILRIHGPLVANRRITTRSVEIGGRKIAAGEQISLMWISANRDGRVFDEPGVLRLDRDPSKNLLYGAGMHVCPGAPLAQMEMCVSLKELLERTIEIQLIPDEPATMAIYPASGFAELPLWIQRAP